MTLIDSIVVRCIRFDGCDVFISALKLFNFTMPSDSESSDAEISEERQQEAISSQYRGPGTHAICFFISSSDSSAG